MGGGVVALGGALGSRLVITICEVVAAASICCCACAMVVASAVEGLERRRWVLFCTIFVARMFAAGFLFSLLCLDFPLPDVSGVGSLWLLLLLLLLVMDVVLVTGV